MPGIIRNGTGAVDRQAADIAEWEAETGKQATVALSTTKDVQDAILADARRAAVVDIIDIGL